MTKPITVKIDEINSYLSAKTKHTKNHLEFFRLANLYNQDKEKMAKNDKQKLQHIISLIYTERKIERDEKRIKNLETKEREKEKKEKRKKYQRLCFVLGGYLMSLGNKYEDGLGSIGKKIPLLYFVIWEAIDNKFIDYSTIPKDIGIKVTEKEYKSNNNDIKKAIELLSQYQNQYQKNEIYFDFLLFVDNFNDSNIKYVFCKLIGIKDNVIYSNISVSIAELEQSTQEYKIKETGRVLLGWHEKYL